MEWLTMPACSSLVCFFNRGNTEATNTLKHYRCNDLCFAGNDFCWLTWKSFYVHIYKRFWSVRLLMTESFYVHVWRFEVCVCLWLSLIVLRWPCVAHSKPCFPAPSSTLCQSWLCHWRGDLYLCLAVRCISALWMVWVLIRLDTT